MLRRYKTIDLFSGCGGMSLGFQNAGFEVLAAYDNWKPAVDVYKLNFEHPIYSEDLADEKVQKRIKAFKPNVIIGGPPCQDFSSAGHRDENLGRAVHPTQLYELAGAALGLPLVFWLVKRLRLQQGASFLLYTAWFSAVRLAVLPLRALTYPDIIKTVVYPLLYVIVILLGIAIVLRRARTKKQP